MNCQEVQELIDDFLVAPPDEAHRAELAQHLQGCPHCARQYESARRALASIQLSHKFAASSHLKERIMAVITEKLAAWPQPTPAASPRLNLWKPALAVALAASLLIGVTLFLRSGTNGKPPVAASAFTVLSQACAAEEDLFTGDDILHIVNEIVVKPVSSPLWARARWLPIMSLEATGKPGLHQLTLSAEVGKGYTVQDQAWYDPATGRFARLLTVDKKPIFANSYDAEAVYSLESAADDTLRLVKHPITDDFQPPKKPAEFLGLAAGLPSRLSEKDKTPVLDVANAGEVTLADGSQAHVLKFGFSQDGAPVKDKNHAYWLTTVRKDNNTIVQMEFRTAEESLFVVRRVKTEKVQTPAVSWNLAEIESRLADSPKKPSAGFLANMVVLNVSLQHMLEKADFETYLFSSDPPWAGKRQISDALDLPSPPHRMFFIAYRADDGRHVVLLQAHSQNKMFGELPKDKKGKVIYTSPTGTKVWSGPRDKWGAGILLQSAAYVIKDPPSDDRTGYLLETASGTFVALAINGQVSEDELHNLIDSLVPAKQCAADEQ